VYKDGMLLTRYRSSRDVSSVYRNKVTGMYHIRVYGKNVALGKAIWIYHYGCDNYRFNTSHKNGDASDFRIENLCLTKGFRSENGGLPYGVYKHPQCGFVIFIKSEYLGAFATVKECKEIIRRYPFC
jgi:hypothetical protein